MALIKLVNDILWNMENGKLTILVCLDLSAAFHTVDHEILMQTPHNCFGISETSLDWFKSYLEERYVKVAIRTEYSSPRKLNFSVHQGSCGGPVLFNCYSSTIKSVMQDDMDIGGFADDHT